MIGEWQLDIDATIQIWKENGMLHADDSGTIEEKELIVRKELLTSMRMLITEKDYQVTTEEYVVTLSYLIEQQGDDWILSSTETENGKEYALWQFKNDGLVYCTGDETGNLEKSMAAKEIVVYIRNKDVNQSGYEQ